MKTQKNKTEAYTERAGRLRRLLPYAGILPLLLAFFLWRGQTLGPAYAAADMLLIVFGYTAALADIRRRIIPNPLVAVMAGVWLAAVLPFLALTGERLLLCIENAGLGLLLGGGILLAIYLISGKKIGGGDVKLMAASGLYLGLSRILTAVFCGFIAGAAVCGILLLAKKIDSRDYIPLAPLLYLGILLTVFFF